jgi:hypothetical protein
MFRRGQTLRAVTLAQSLGEGGDPRVGADQGQAGFGSPADQELVADDLGPEAALAGGLPGRFGNGETGRPVQQEEAT